MASSYCGLCHIKLCTSIFNRGTIWQPANGRHKGTAAHFSDAKKMHTQAKLRPCGSFFRICAFPPSVIIMRVCATISIGYSSLSKPLFLHPRWDAPNRQSLEQKTSRKLHLVHRCFQMYIRGWQCASPLSHCFPSNRKCVSLWKTLEGGQTLASLEQHIHTSSGTE